MTRAAIAIFGFIACLIGSTAVVVAAESPKQPPALSASMIAVIDVQRVLQESRAAKHVQKQIEAQRAAFQTETEKEENALRKDEQDLSKLRSANSAAYAEREQQLRQRTLTVERHFEARRKKLDQAFTEAKNSMNAALTEIVQTLAHERGLSVVLIKQQTLWAEPTLDLTAEVLDRLNKKMPQMPIKITGEKP